MNKKTDVIQRTVPEQKRPEFVKNISRNTDTTDQHTVKWEKDPTRKNKWLTGFSEFYRDLLIARVPESISHPTLTPILKRVNN